MWGKVHSFGCNFANLRMMISIRVWCYFLVYNFELKSILKNKVFAGSKQNYKNIDWISKRQAVKHNDVDILNFIIQNQIPGELHSYKSVASLTDEAEATYYPTEFLNSLDVPGTPPHNLQLKVGSTIIMLRNLNHPKLCNGTRLTVKKLMNNLILANKSRSSSHGYPLFQLIFHFNSSEFSSPFNWLSR